VSIDEKGVGIPSELREHAQWMIFLYCVVILILVIVLNAKNANKK
jgi:uncharacterized integral membrane protein